MACSKSPQNNLAQGGLGSLFPVGLDLCKPRHTDMVEQIQFRTPGPRRSFKQLSRVIFVGVLLRASLIRIQLVRLSLFSFPRSRDQSCLSPL